MTPPYVTAVAGGRTVGRWSLQQLLPDTAEATVASRLADLESAVARFEAHRDTLDTLDRAGLVAALAEYEAISESMNVLAAFGSLWFSEDTQSPAALGYRTRMQRVLTDLGNRLLFFGLWWKGLDDDAAERLLPDAASDADRRHFLLELRRMKPYTLDERSEQIVNLKDSDGIEAVLTLHSILTNRLEFRFEVDGRSETLTRDALMAYAHSSRPEERAAAYQELFRVYGAEATVFGQMYVHRVRDWHSEQVRLRGHASPIAARNVANDIPDAAVETLLDVARANRTLFQRYFRLKAGWLGVDRLRRYDVYAPIAASQRSIPWSEAVDLVLDTFQRFDPRFAAMAERVFADGHVDSEVRKGKKAGAFCATVLPRLTPWVLVNYNGRMRDVATLAHELGHAVHSMAAEEHSILTQHPSLPLAETASVFAEMLMTDRLLERESDPLARRELLVAAMDDIYATVMRQAYFVRFERAAHDAVLADRSVDELCDLYFDGLQEQFGDSVELAPEFRHEWLAIPHIYLTPFYCYAYSFGQLLVLALYRRYQEQGDAFKPGYLRLLAHGGSARPEEILREAGVDMRDPAFWQAGFNVVGELVDDLEKLGTKG